MLRDYSLIVTNALTNEVVKIPEYSFIAYETNDLLKSQLLYAYLGKFIDNQIPFKVEFFYKPSTKI